MQKQLIECVPNISEGRDLDKIHTIANCVETVEGVKLLDVDPGAATNRTVITFVGEPEQVIQAAFILIKKASELIDMSKHSGEHPRFGATDVCPLVPISGITLEETAKYAHKLGKRVGEELDIPVYLYENAAQEEKRVNLANCRAGEYEGLPKKLLDPNWKPDFGPAEFNNKVATTGATAISARDFLVAYNVNLNTTSTRRANAIAFDIREAGRVKREGNPITGKKVLDNNGEPVRIPGKLKAVKGIGWFIEEYGIAQISYNLTNISITSMHEAFDETDKAAQERGLRVTGSELIGLIPLKAMLDAGDYFLKKQERSLGVSEAEKIKIAVKSLGLDDLKPFNPNEKIIEYVLRDKGVKQLIDLTLTDFADETAGESMAPGGGSISAYVGTLGVSLGTMVANLSAHKPGWDDRWEEFSVWAEKGQAYKNKLLALVDEDTNAFNKIIEGFRMPKSTDQEKKARAEAIESATIYATEVPLLVMETACDSMEVMMAMAKGGLQNSLSDAGVGTLCARTAVYGAYFNVRINAKDIKNRETAKKLLNKAKSIFDKTLTNENEMIALIDEKI
ncbi:glutamate formimidoyltransferase [Flavobacteriaceae bacterium S0825]|uniref:glutamate formimidoyltransferase n=1 Tax=Gaetbulibacter sp. S0825 TaxID=2720084 RepID=UPI0014309E78|nr:glutamate formimidoyltransferase [Gaetbulibacter sp. S0825]MCK0109740.1 glutamate formimidoyltransferase [Flavobacteriaceae bacterium S0825]NIX65372.1 glutamate formimidoyltransferase [Gaetbulibacter sp. S0825]